MALFDVDKDTHDRSSPMPNSHDKTVGPQLSFHYPALPQYSANTGAIDLNHTSNDLQTAINRVSGLGGGDVVLPNGTYVLTTDLTIPSNVRLLGQTENNVVLYFATANGIVIRGSQPYTTGTVTTYSASSTVTGTGTQWLANLTTSHSIEINGFIYSIKSVDSDTQITLNSPFFGVPVHNAAYKAAIYVSNPTLQNLVIVTSATAITMDYSSSPIFQNVVIPSGAYYGILGTNSSLCTFTDVVVYGATKDGIYLSECSNVAANNTVSNNNGGNGWFMNDCTSLLLNGCPTLSNSFDGFHITGGSQSAFIVCEGSGNGGCGVSASSTTDLIVTGGAYNDNGNDGLQFQTSNYSIISQATFKGNAGFGLDIIAGSDHIIATSNVGNVNDGGTSDVVANNVT